MENKLYVIVFAVILSNAQAISQNENNRYSDDLHDLHGTTTMATAAISITNAPDVVKMHNTLDVGYSNKHQLQLPESTTTIIGSDIGNRFMNENVSDQGKERLEKLQPPPLVSAGDLKPFSLEPHDTSVVDDSLDDGFKELSLDDATENVSKEVALNKAEITIDHNIYKIARSNKANAIKSARLEPSKSSILPGGNSIVLSEMHGSESNGSIFNQITYMYDQFLWKSNEITQSAGRKCATDIAIYLKSLERGHRWALKASDSSGRYRGQFLFNNNNWLGSTVFCAEAKNDASISLSFYVATVAIVYPDVIDKGQSLQVGQCLPDTCSVSDVQQILSLDPTAITLNAGTTTKVTVTTVRRVPGDYSLMDDRFFHCFIVAVTLFGLLTIASTLYEIRQNHIATEVSASFKKDHLDYDVMKSDMVHSINSANGQNMELQQISIENNNDVRMNTNMQTGVICQPKGLAAKNDDKTAYKKEVKLGGKSESIRHQLLISFALGSNLKSIFSTKKLSSDSIPCIHGMKVFSLLWIIMVHTYLQMFGISENKGSRKITEETFFYQIIGNATYAVDTFFFLSGLLVTIVFLRSKEASSSLQDIGFSAGAKRSVLLFIYRYMRLTPAFLMVIVIDTIALKYTYDTSVFPAGLADHLICPNYWWRNILYIQTWYPFSELCMIWSWYLADDMQFYVWSIILMIISIRHPKAALSVISLTLVMSWIITAYVSLRLNYSFRLAEPLESFGVLYEKPWARLGPYVMGMLAGYIMINYKSPPKIPVILNLFLWICSFAIMFLMVFGVWNGSLSVIWTAVYVSLGHTAWGLALIWITLSCSWGLSQPVNKILSVRVLLPLSRLAYCAYLIHPVTQIVMSFQLKGTLFISHELVLTIFLGNTVVSYLFALAISLMFEAPVVRILRILFKK